MSIKRRSFIRTMYCVNCGRMFKATRSHAKACSPRCRMVLSRAGQKSKRESETGITLSQLDFLLEMNGGK